jgi:hypothetical protein
LDPDTYDLSIADKSGKYEYQGTRTAPDGQYVLIFDPAKKHFVLHQLDSSFDMNLTGVPWPVETSLRDTYEQLPTSVKSRRKSASGQRTRATKDNSTKDSINDTKRRKVEKPKKPKPPPREPTPDAEDEDSEDGLTIEYPGGPTPPRFGLHSSPLPRRIVEEAPSEDSDADADFEEDDDGERNKDVEDLKLPSPLNNAADEDMEDDLELDLEAALEEALETETGARPDESSESEEE